MGWDGMEWSGEELELDKMELEWSEVFHNVPIIWKGSLTGNNMLLMRKQILFHKSTLPGPGSRTIANEMLIIFI